jgi:uncharacterized protein YjbI with pentapeptide repeats
VRDLEKALKRIGEGGKLDARGVLVTEELLGLMIAAAPLERGHARLAGAEFSEAVFVGQADFTRVIFDGAAVFTDAEFRSHADFYQARFEGTASFDRANWHASAAFGGAVFAGDATFSDAAFKDTARFREAEFLGGEVRFDCVAFGSDADFPMAIFHGRALFSGTGFHGDSDFEAAKFNGGAAFAYASFDGEAFFPGATFRDHAWFEDAIFKDATVFSSATFHGSAGFRRVAFKRDCGFEAAEFNGDAWFDDAAFGGKEAFRGVIFKRQATFRRAAFEQARGIGPVLAHRGLALDDARFAHPVRIEVSTTGLCCRRAQFSGGVQFWLRWARVVLDDSQFAAPSTVTGIPRLSDDKLARNEQQIARAWRRLLARQVSERPRLLSLRRANVAGLGLSGVDLSDCRFAGAHNLDKLRLDADVLWLISPASLKWDWRTVIAEERSWRTGRSSRWIAPSWPRWAGEVPPTLEAGQIAELYRALRKGREDNKDEPGATAFYYGEMQMRRHARYSSEGSRGRVERSILTVYWLVSGYGLTAWRAFAWLGAVIAGFAAAFHLIGFARPPQPPSYWASLLYAFRATLSLTDNTALTAWGQLLQALLRLSGPVLLALALLAVRNRVKR